MKPAPFEWPKGGLVPPVATNPLDGSGGFRQTNAIDGNLPARFFHIVLP